MIILYLSASHKSNPGVTCRLKSSCLRGCILLEALEENPVLCFVQPARPITILGLGPPPPSSKPVRAHPSDPLSSLFFSLSGYSWERLLLGTHLIRLSLKRIISLYLKLCILNHICKVPLSCKVVFVVPRIKLLMCFRTIILLSQLVRYITLILSIYFDKCEDCNSG